MIFKKNKQTYTLKQNDFVLAKIDYIGDDDKETPYWATLYTGEEVGNFASLKDAKDFCLREVKKVAKVLKNISIS